MTSTKQNFARKYKIPIDTMDLDYEVVKNPDTAEKPEDGVHILGMNMEGCRWDGVEFQLAESEQKILFTMCPLMLFQPVLAKDKRTEGIYKCPVYLTMERKGILATTGHSTNFVTKVSLPSDRPESHWIKRGAAMICALSD